MIHRSRVFVPTDSRPMYKKWMHRHKILLHQPNTPLGIQINPPPPGFFQKKKPTMSSPTSSPPQSFRSANSQRRPSDTSTSTDDDTFHSLAPSPSNASTTNTVILRPPDRSSLVDTTIDPAPYSLTTTSFGQGDDSSLQSSASTHSGYRMGYHSGPVPEWPLGDNEPTRPAAPGFKYDATTATNDTTTATGPSASAGSTHTDETCNSQDGRATNTTPQEDEMFSTRHSQILSVDTTGIPVTTMSTGSTIADGRDELRVIRLPVPPDTPPTKNSKWNCFSDCFSRQE